MQIDFFNSLSFRVLRSTFAWALALGLLVSAVTISLDYRQVRQQFDNSGLCTGHYRHAAAVFYLQVTRPLNSVTRSIVTLGDKEHLEDRLTIPVGHERSEIGILVRTTNKHLDSIANVLDRLRLAEIKLTRYSDGLVATVAARTAELTASLTQLEAARDQLIQSEKMAALDGLVAGVAHEVNTPLGIAVTASSALTEALQELNTSFEQQTLNERQFKQLVGQIAEGNELLSSNIHRAAKLISDFKKTAVDQISETLCEFKVKDTINALIASLHPETRRVPVTPEVSCPEDLTIVGLPGVLSQILTNLIINSVRHAFENMETPAEIRIAVSRSDDSVELEYKDNGAGVPTELHARVSEPFFTTKRGKGGAVWASILSITWSPESSRARWSSVPNRARECASNYGFRLG